MSEYNFYYDESEHSRRINLNTVSTSNFYDNFIAVILGWKNDDEISIFEEKYAERKKNGELKSHTFKQSQFTNGFASLNRNNVSFINDFFSIFDGKQRTYLTIANKIEFIISQIFDCYQNNEFLDTDLMKYSIVKSLLTYQPKEVIEGVFEDTSKLVEALKVFFNDRIEKNRINPQLKSSETIAFKEILLILNDVHAAKTLNWNYDILFYGFKQYLTKCEINDYTLVIDREGENSNTLNAAVRMGLKNVS